MYKVNGRWHKEYADEWREIGASLFMGLLIIALLVFASCELAYAQSRYLADDGKFHTTGVGGTPTVATDMGATPTLGVAAASAGLSIPAIVGSDPGGSGALRVAGGLTILDTKLLENRSNFTDYSGFFNLQSLPGAPTLCQKKKWVQILDNGIPGYIFVCY